MTSFQPERAVTTTLIHRRAHGPRQWWHQAVVCDFVGAAHSAELENINGLVLDVARAGFQAIALQPAPEMLVPPSWEIHHLCAIAKQAGMRVIFRIPLPAVTATSGVRDAQRIRFDEAYAEALLSSVRVALEAGADGIDLALLDSEAASPGVEERDRLAALIRRVQVELVDINPSAVLSAEAVNADEQALTFHLEEEWLHHLRDRALLDAPWQVDVLRHNVEHALAQRDFLGHVAAWHWSRTRHVDAPGDVFDLHGIPASSWEFNSDSARRTAMSLFALSLPGAAYMPFAFMGGRLVASSATLRRVWEGDKDAAIEAKTLQDVLCVREEREMGTGSLAWVDGLPWTHEGVSVHVCAGVLVVLNASAHEVAIPVEHQLLVSSAPVSVPPGHPTVLPPNTCAWFETARVQRRPVFLND